MSEKPWKIHKFGGSSLADASCFRRVGDILAGLDEPAVGVVVSAMSGMTDDLLKLTRMAERDDSAYRASLRDVGERYAATTRELVQDALLVDLLDRWADDAHDIEETLNGIAARRSVSPQGRDMILGFGEIWSARLLAAYLEKTLGAERGGKWIDAREVITVRHGELGPNVMWEPSRAKLAKILPDMRGIVVITGFIAADEDGMQTTLGRNGSDYSAAIFAALTGADQLTIWTDVDGVMSADPRRVPEAQIIDSLSYNEAMELAYFGAKVLHPQSLGPAIDNKIPIAIKNTFKPNEPGSNIQDDVISKEQIKGITAIGNVALINVEGTGMIGVPGTADRMFAALKNAGVSVTLISQASSEHSICIAVPCELAGRARGVIVEAFADELSSGQLQDVEVTDNQSIIAVVGDRMAGAPGIAARFFGTLGNAGINIRAIAQGSSERNISAVVNSEDVTRALRAVHSGFYLSAKTISIGLIGPGTVGGTLLDQISRQSRRLREEFNLDLRVRAIARSSHMLLGDRRIDLSSWRDAVRAANDEFDFDTFIAHVNPDHLPHAVIIDCTSDEDVASRYAGWLAKGIHVITPNKKAFSSSQSYYEDLHRAAKLGNAHCFYETTVGAALPIIKTLRDLVDTGDRVHAVQGILSGTLAYLFNLYDGTTAFSEIVRKAKTSGYTEPDPRDDLSGMDVARKLTILARELGQSIEIGEFPVENLIPEALRDVSTETFLDRLSEYDGEMLTRYDAARTRGKALRYVARLSEDGDASVSLAEIDRASPFSNIDLTDNIIQFTTDRYADNPLVVQGPGAGPEVTAGGVFGDVLRLAAVLGDGSRL